MMTSASLLQFFLWVPLVAVLISAIVPAKMEKLISGIAVFSTGLQLAGTLGFVSNWLLNGSISLNIKHLTVFQADDIEIFIDFYFDKTTAVFGVVGAMIAFIVAIFSRTYLHREAGFKRYFSVLLLFIFGYNVIVFSGNFETLFVGWEILGLCSFLLIAFYRDRYLPVKNSLKVLSIYRLGDVCLILGMWMSHHLWYENITFASLNDTAAVLAHLAEHNWYGVFIATMVLLAASMKSAQMPFSTWLPRAMEGPSSSSAIFYGSLSVHLGAFLLLRTYPYWESILGIKVAIVTVGVVTSILASSTAQVQSSVKTQIAYASIAQIGLIFIEIALGWHWIALLHFAGNAFLRTYQLLVSPSVLGYRLHEMFFKAVKPTENQQQPWMRKIRHTWYVLSVKEWNLDKFLSQILWSPFKWMGHHLGFLSHRVAIGVLAIIYLGGIYASYFGEQIPDAFEEWLPYFFSLLSLMLTLRAFAERGSAIAAWIFIVAGQATMALSIALLHEDFGHLDILIYLSGSMLATVLGMYCLLKIKAIDNEIGLNQFHGYVYERPALALLFLVACFAMIGLPFTPTFIGIDILFSHIHKREWVLIAFTALSFIFVELSVVRIYTRIFLGIHKKSSHAAAYRSS